MAWHSSKAHALAHSRGNDSSQDIYKMRQLLLATVDLRLVC